MTISKRLKNGALLLAALSFVFAFASCDLLGEKDKKEDIEIEGTWHESTFGSGLVITNDTIEFHTAVDGIFSDATKYQECEIVSYDNDGFNADDSGTGDCGFMVIKYTEPSSYISSIAQDKYGIFRWQNLNTASGVTTMSYSEGYIDSDGDWSADKYSDTAESAETDFTDEVGAFSFSSISLQ